MCFRNPGSLMGIFIPRASSLRVLSGVLSCLMMAIMGGMAVAGERGTNAQALPASVPGGEKMVNLLPPALNASFPEPQWVFVSGRKDAAISETWRIGVDEETKAPILICNGEPHGYLRTRAAFENFDLQLEWRFPKDPNGNSGILLFTSGEDRVWPVCLQVQLHQPELGAVFPIGGAKSANELPGVGVLAKPVNQWNRCDIHCRSGEATVTINGQLIGTVIGCNPLAGTIGLQSEGSEIHFRAISIREATREATVVQPENHPFQPSFMSKTAPADSSVKE